MMCPTDEKVHSSQYIYQLLALDIKSIEQRGLHFMKIEQKYQIFNLILLTFLPLFTFECICSKIMQKYRSLLP